MDHNDTEDDNNGEIEVRNIGRPTKSSDSNIRQHLMTVAFDLFANHEYNQVSTRKVACCSQYHTSDDPLLLSK
ncbi:hypothetical protein [Moritella marina]|uniref:hypothetical protein n=1 Tax=Moritella marina TaxID=90736 RepID=UPI0037049B92